MVYYSIVVVAVCYYCVDVVVITVMPRTQDHIQSTMYSRLMRATGSVSHGCRPVACPVTVHKSPVSLLYFSSSVRTLGVV